ncbi:MAG: hypothetical protein GWM98_08355 [Nitrospinaceae bacterium]|nr:hypothetical protein [Nitrospinaceae bacterium]NIU44008.1 hypothetical protein [Nitrospinaceae bacterium]NIU96121.1 hypothetical protein [Nitrospinaceae bacterium]NIW05598.1 hypothetical protein [Nitrospinaceae bacterium]NIW58769.1 hypothetical protein [Nitrospinaceae bacterium]
MNNKRVSETGNSLVVRNETEESGVSQIQMVARNYTRTFQIDDRSLLLNFGGGSAGTGNVFR